MKRKVGGDYVKACTRSVMDGKAPVGRPRKTGQNTLSPGACTERGEHCHKRTFNETEEGGLRQTSGKTFLHSSFFKPM